jgi:GntR family transcriptional regulator
MAVVMSEALGVSAPKYERLVRVLRSRIEDGTYLPGTLLPSQNDLVREFGVSRPTVIEALRVLRQEGWLDTQTGRGSFVRGRVPRDTAAHEHPGQSLLERAESDLAADLLQAGIVAAPARVIALLDLPAGSKAFLRQYVLNDVEEPTELISAWFPLDLATGTALTSPEPMQEGIRRHLQQRKGVRLDHAVERVIARAANADEAAALHIPQGAPVLNVLVTGHDANGIARQLVDAVLPGDRHELKDVYPLT